MIIADFPSAIETISIHCLNNNCLKRSEKLLNHQFLSPSHCKSLLNYFILASAWLDSSEESRLLKNTTAAAVEIT